MTIPGSIPVLTQELIVLTVQYFLNLDLAVSFTSALQLHTGLPLNAPFPPLHFIP